MGRNSHDGSGTIIHQHIIGDIDRHLFPVQRIDRITIQEQTFLLQGGSRPFDVTQMIQLFLERQHGFFRFSSANQFPDKGMLGSQNHISHSIQSIRPCGKYFQLVV